MTDNDDSTTGQAALRHLQEASKLATRTNAGLVKNRRLVLSRRAMAEATRELRDLSYITFGRKL